MPSGDSASCAVLQGILWTLFKLRWPMYTVLPLTMCGRVYVFCHWFGDTVVGAAIGLAFSAVSTYALPTIGQSLF